MYKKHAILSVIAGILLLWSGYAHPVALFFVLYAILVASLWLLRGVIKGFWHWLWMSKEERRIAERDATTESPLELMLAAELDRRGIAYKREYRISNTRVDFAFPDAKLVVECDGWRYHHHRAKEDAARDAFLKREGWKVLRLPGELLRKDVRRCGELVAHALR